MVVETDRQKDRQRGSFLRISQSAVRPTEFSFISLGRRRRRRLAPDLAVWPHTRKSKRHQLERRRDEGILRRNMQSVLMTQRLKPAEGRALCAATTCSGNTRTRRKKYVSTLQLRARVRPSVRPFRTLRTKRRRTRSRHPVTAAPLNFFILHYGGGNF